MTRWPGPALVVVSGLPGTGKSTLAVALARRLGAVHLSIDVAEEALLSAGLPADWTTGVAAYEVTGALAAANLELSSVVVVDAVNDSEAARSTWHRAVQGSGAALHLVVAVCSDVQEHRARLAGRRRPFTKVPEPTWADVQRRAAEYEPWQGPHTVVDTVQPLAASLEQVAAALQHEPA